jgi:hypothetical protein
MRCFAYQLQVDGEAPELHVKPLISTPNVANVGAKKQNATRTAMATFWRRQDMIILFENTIFHYEVAKISKKSHVSWQREILI